jgi:hypothetical protein
MRLIIPGSGPQGPREPAMTAPVEDAFSASVERLTSHLVEEDGYSAPIRLPNRDSLAIQLVDMRLLHALDDLREDARFWQSLFWCSFGIGTGLLGNALMGGEVTTYAGAALGLCVVLCGVFGIFWGRANARTAAAHKKLLEGAVAS